MLEAPISYIISAKTLNNTKIVIIILNSEVDYNQIDMLSKAKYLVLQLNQHRPSFQNHFQKYKGDEIWIRAHRYLIRIRIKIHLFSFWDP